MHADVSATSLRHLPMELPAPPLLSVDAALFLDFDGTLAELAPRPDSVSVEEQLPALLEALGNRLQGAVALLTGRALSTVDTYLAPLQLPGAGLHGAELRSEQLQAPVRDPRCASVAQLGRRLRLLFEADPRVVVEDKLAGVALHFRQAPERQLECHVAVDSLIADYGDDLEAITGKMVIEARLRGVSKGHALRTLMATAPFARRSAVVLGDDDTDEEAFLAAQALGGHAIKVGTGRTHANFRLAAVAEVHAWLRDSLRQLAS